MKHDTIHIETAGELHYTSIGADSVVIEKILRDTLKEFVRIYKPGINIKDTIWNTSFTQVKDTIYQKSEPVVAVKSVAGKIKDTLFDLFICILIVLISVLIFTWRNK